MGLTCMEDAFAVTKVGNPVIGYLKQVAFDDENVSMIDEVPKAKLVINTEIFNADETLLCEGTVVLGFINSDTRRPVRCPDELASLFSEHLN